ncbi:hypothetical protein ILUMI_15354, partial [Ignelater luminosus]
MVNDARKIIQDEPTSVIRRLAKLLDVSYGTCQDILRGDLELYPYKLQIYQKLLPPDYNKRVEFRDNPDDDNLLD